MWFKEKFAAKYNQNIKIEGSALKIVAGGNSENYALEWNRTIIHSECTPSTMW